jgi:hypothetical protein
MNFHNELDKIATSEDALNLLDKSGFKTLSIEILLNELIEQLKINNLIRIAVSDTITVKDKNRLLKKLDEIS